MGYIALLVIVVSDLYKFNIVCGLETFEFWREIWCWSGLALGCCELDLGGKDFNK